MRMMKCLLFGLFLSVVPAHAGTFAAASCNQTDVASAIASAIAAGSGNTVTIPAGTCTWTSNVTSPASGTLPNISIIGATNCTGTGSATSPIACTDNTVINSSGGAKWYLLAGAGTTVRLSGVTLNTAATTDGFVNVQGPSSGTVPLVRLDHIHGNMSSNGDTSFDIASVTGVIDHSLFDEPVSSEGNSIRFFYPLAGDSGDQSWANVTGLGTAGYMYVENNTFNHGVANDGQEGARFVFRFNTFNDTSVQTHPTGGDGRGRGARAWEIYDNTFAAASGCEVECGNAFFMSSGTGTVWGNTGNSVYSGFVTIHSMRINDATYPQTVTPNGWGYCGTAFNGTGSNWDRNTSSVTGYPCLDQPGQGVGDLLSGNFPSVTNVALGTPAWPRQALEPVYEWGDAWTGSSSVFWSVGSSTAQLQSNRDFYLWCNASSPSGCTSAFNGTVGTGTGTLASRPSTCTTGVAYWATDQGNWNTASTAGPQSSVVGVQGELFKCTATNTWTLFYTPYTYPHPLTQGTIVAPPPPTNVQGTAH